MRLALIGTVILAGTAPAQADDPRSLSLADAVKIAIASDAELYIGREELRTADDAIALAESAFAPRVFGQTWWARDDKPPSAFTFGGVESAAVAEAGFTGRIGTGMAYTLSARFERQRASDPFGTVYDPASSTSLRVEVVQPLLRGAFVEARRPIKVASLRKGFTALELRTRVETTVARVEAAYWNLVRVRAEHEARTSAVAFAKEQVVESKRVTKLGQGSDLDVVEAESGVRRRELELLRSGQEVIEAEGKLLAAMGVRDGDRGWIATGFAPTETITLDKTAPKLAAQLELAHARRSDALAAREQVVVESAALAVTADRQRIGLDVVVAGGTRGFAGALADNYVKAGVNGGGLDPPFDTNSAYDGGIGKSILNLAGRDPNVFVGLRLDVPLGDHEAKVRHTIQGRAVSRARLVERTTLSKIDNEVRTATARVALDLDIIATADDAVVLAEKLLEGMRKRFRAGAATSFDVLRVSDDLTRVRVEAVRARTDYRISTARLASATGTVLDPYGISIESLGKSPP